MTPARDEALDELTGRVGELDNRLTVIESSAGKVTLNWQAWGVLLTIMAMAAGMLAFVVRMDTRQQEQGSILRMTVEKLDDHVQAPGHAGELERLDGLQRQVDRIETRPR